MENLNIYQEYTLYQILMRIGTQPYIAITSDNDELLDTFINEITKRIVKVKKYMIILMKENIPHQNI